MMRPGDHCEIAIWLTGTETEEHLKRWKEIDAPAMIKNTEQMYEVEIGPLEFTSKLPGEDRVPQVPDHISGPNVQLLVAEAKVIALKPRPKITQYQPGFINDLREEDLKKLRHLTRRNAPPGQSLNNAQCDAIIEQLGPDAALKTIRDSLN